MDVLYLILLYLVYFFLVILVEYYVKLLSSKTEYTRDELLNIAPPVFGTMGKIMGSFAPVMVVGILTVSSIIGALIPFISHWIFQSAIPLVLIYFLFPVIGRYIEERKVTSSEYYRDAIANIFAARNDLITLGVGLGLGAGGMFWWAYDRGPAFLWLVPNLAVITLLLVVTVRKIAHD